MTSLLLTVLALNAMHARWNAADAFAQKGLLESYTPLEGMEWRIDEAVTVSFHTAAASREPQAVFNPGPCVWLCHGAEIRLEGDGYDLVQVTVSTLADYPFVSGQARAVPEGTLTLKGTDRLRWEGVSPDVIISQPGPYDSLQDAGARVAVTFIEALYTAPGAGIAETELSDTDGTIRYFDLQGRPVTARPNHGLYITSQRRLIRL